MGKLNLIAEKIHVAVQSAASSGASSTRMPSGSVECAAADSSQAAHLAANCAAAVFFRAVSLGALRDSYPALQQKKDLDE